MTCEQGTGPPDPGIESAPADLWPDEARGKSAGRHDPVSITHKPVIRLRCSTCNVRMSWRNVVTGNCAACACEVAR